MREQLRQLLDAIARWLVDWLIDVFLEDEIAWLEERIDRVPELRSRLLTPEECAIFWGHDDHQNHNE